MLDNQLPQPLAIWRIFSQTIRVYIGNLPRLAIAAAVINAPLIIFESLALLSNADSATIIGVGATFLIPFIILSQPHPAIVLSGSLAIAVQCVATTVIVIPALRERKPLMSQVLECVRRRWRALLGAVVFMFFVNFVLITVLGSYAYTINFFIPIPYELNLMVLIISLTFLNVRFLPVWQTIAIENLEFVRGMERAWNLTKHSFWRVLVIVLVLSAALVMFHLSLIFFWRLVASTAELSLFVRVIVAITMFVFVTPFQFTVLAIVYYDLLARDEWSDAHTLAFLNEIGVGA